MAEMKGPDYKVWYRPQYLNSVCHICKSLPENGITCSKCHLVTYCGIEHLEDDLDDHEELCDALETVAQILGSKHALDKAYLLGAEQLRDFRIGLITLCTKHMQRPLLPWEMEVCLFPPLCVSCHKFAPNTLISCPNCVHIKWCSQQHKPKNHDKFCSQIILFREVLQKRVHIIKSLKLNSLPKCIDEILVQNNHDKIEFCLLSEVASSPLSILNTFSEEILHNNTLTIHVVGPEPNFEANNLIKWEAFLFDLLPTTVKHLQLDFIGPEIGPLNERTIIKDGRKLKFTFHQILYHEYIDNEVNNNSKANIVVAFNPGLYRNEGFQGKDTWSETIKTMFLNNNVPVLITAYTEKEILLDFKRIKDTIKNIQILTEPSRNLFSSRRPLMNFVSDEVTPIVFKNAYHMILSI